MEMWHLFDGLLRPGNATQGISDENTRICTLLKAAGGTQLRRLKGMRNQDANAEAHWSDAIIGPGIRFIKIFFINLS